MRFIDEFRDPAGAEALLEAIRQEAKGPITLMEICGGQTHTVLQYGLDRLLPDSVRLVHGPGCPVCVTPVERIDRTLAIAAVPGVIMAVFGDMMRVPGSTTDLASTRARGADVRVVYSPLDAIRLATQHPDREVVFFAIGFETTAPAVAMAVCRARELALTNFSILPAHVLVPPAMAAILAAPDCAVQGFIAAGHVCTVMGYRQYEALATRFGVPMVVTGFEPLDLLAGIRMLIAAHHAGRATVENQYRRSVTRNGNVLAQRLIQRVFDVCDCPWRGLGWIPDSGLSLTRAYRDLDAELRFPVTLPEAQENRSCRAGDVLRGLIRPTECESFGRACTPETPLGAPMVSAEGACAAYFRYGRES